MCYHGFELDDECQYVPGLFIRQEVFEQRLTYLKDKGFNVITLDQLWKSYEKGEIAKNCVVITIDDGFYSVYAVARPILTKLQMPSTLYLTTYYYNKSSPVFTLAVRYLFWKSKRDQVALSELDIPLVSDINPETPGDRQRHFIELICTHGQQLACNQKRLELLSQLGRLLQVDFEDINHRRLLNLIDERELEACRQAGIDIQLHTHRHRFPTEESGARYEIEKNKQCLSTILDYDMTHFCYPSGEWQHAHWASLQSLNIRTATTCKSGLVDIDTPRYAWNRILDSARVSQLEFEAEIMGFNELLRRGIGNLRRLVTDGHQEKNFHT
ncbi:hypothetical protein GCM10009092_37550 [Bowmanella denitrificans]|uniref:NodB homology domain-containing protein n=1 Tax=Bowmanella denitrificans TaxID=366582 RepID=A0ABP3HGV0_9ALTE